MHAVPNDASHPDGLTAREAEVAALLTQGLSNGEIADRLVLSTKTVAHHVSAILAKLNLERRSQVAAALGSVPATSNRTPWAERAAVQARA